MARTLQDRNRHGSTTAAVARNGAAASEQTAFVVGERGAAAEQPAAMAMSVMPSEDATRGIGAPAAALSDEIRPSTGRDGAAIAGAPLPEAIATSDLATAGSGARRTLQGHIEADWRSIKGWVWDPTTPTERIRLELLDGDTRLATTVASENRPGLILSGIGDGRHGFTIEMTDGLIPEGRHVLHLRCADSGAEVPGSPIVLEGGLSAPTPKALAPEHRAIPFNGTIRRAVARISRDTTPELQTEALAAIHPRLVAFRSHLDGVDSQWRLSGWPYDPSHQDPLDIQLVEDDVAIAAAKANDFRADLIDAGVGDGHCAFYIRIPGRTVRRHLSQPARIRDWSRSAGGGRETLRDCLAAAWISQGYGPASGRGNQYF